MLKRKKQNVYLRFGLKPQPGVLVATFVLPRDEFKDLTLADWHYNTSVDRTRNQFDLVITTSINKKILIDSRLGTGEVYGPVAEIENNRIPILVTDPDKAYYGGLGFLVYVNEKKEIIYRHPDGELTSTESITKNEVIETLIYDPPAVNPDGLIGTFTQRVTRDVWTVGESSQSFSIVDKTITLNGEDNNNIVNVKTILKSESTTKSQLFYDFYRDDGEIITKTGYGPGDILNKSGGVIEFALSPMHTIFMANHTWENDIENGWQQKTKSFNIIDKDGDSTVNVENGNRPTKIFPTRPDNGEGQLYWDNWSFYDEAWPTVLKSNDKEDFLMLPQTGPAFIIKDEIKYVLESGSFDINGVKYEIGNLYPQFFATENMMHQRWKYFAGVEWKSYGFHGAWGFGSWRERAYMTYSWFGDYMYRIRVDELVEEPLFSQNPIDVVTAGNPNYVQQEMDYMLGEKAKAEALGFKPGAFFLDVINNTTTDQQMKDLVSFIGVSGGINNFLKIYQPETDKLWIEKFQIEYTSGQAKITFKERFLNPFHSPLTANILGIGDWDIDTLEKYIPALKSICYVPYDYMPPVDD